MTSDVKAIQTFVCLNCGIPIDQPVGKNGFLKCAKGHRVQIVKSRPLWRISSFAFGIALSVTGILIHLFQTVWVSGLSHYAVWSVLLALFAWGIYLVVQGRRYTASPAPIGTIGREYIASGTGKVLAALVLGALEAIEISY